MDSQAETWMKPLVKGNQTGMVEIPANWYLDDLPPMMYMKKVPNSHGFVNARDIEDLWRVSVHPFLVGFEVSRCG